MDFSVPGEYEQAAPDRLTLLDTHTVVDLEQFVARARRLDANAAIWLAAHGSALVATASPLFGAGLTDPSPTLLGVKVLPLAQPSPIEYAAEAQALSDRLVRMRREDETTLRTPPVEVREVWTAVTPPRSGWRRVAEVPVDTVREVARAGIHEIGTGAPAGSGELAVHELRGRVWGREADAMAGLLSGLAFTLDGFGFLGSGRDAADQAATAGATVQLYDHGLWQRAAGRYGDAIVRLPSRF